MPASIQFSGLPEIRDAIKRLGNVADTAEFKAAGYNVASKVVIPAARARATSVGRMQVRAAKTLAPVKTPAGGAVRFGAGFRGAMGAEFGADRNQRRNTRDGLQLGWNQFKPWRGSGENAGYFLWPAIRANAEQIIEAFANELDPLLERLFPE
jgi:hypothetical protein